MTYDYVLLDAGDDMIPAIGAGCGIAMVVSEFGPGDPRTMNAFHRISEVSDANTMLLVVDPAAPATDDAETSAGAAA
jgi:hypothetical protein